MKKAFLIISILAPMFLSAQDASDLFDFSSVYYQGTAKSADMGNAMGAVGSDYSAITINPASLGLFRKSTFTYTPEFFAISTESNYKDSNASDRAFKVPSNNIGLTWTADINEGALKTVSFALGINHLNNYTFSSYVNGNNPYTSLIDAYFTEFDENGIMSDIDLEDYSPNNIYPMWETYLIDFHDDGSYSTPIPAGGLNQKYGISKKGKSRQLSFASGFNFNDRFFLGLELNVVYFDRTKITDYREENLYSGYFRNWHQQENITNSGRGLNAKIGAIVYPVRWLRLGAAFHSPSIYDVTDSWYTLTESVFSDNNYSYQSPTGTYSYTMTTPYRFNASAALIFGNYGMITGDYEFVDYSTMRASSYDYNYTALNNFIKETYSSTSNIRIGTEWRWQTLAFRAGYAIYGSPFGFDKEDLKTTSYSCGFGYTYHRFTIDAAYVLSKRNNSYDLYSQYSMYPAYYWNDNNELVADETKVKETTNINQVVISFKFRLD